MSDPVLVELFDPFAPHARKVLEQVAVPGDVDGVLEDARAAFGRIAPEMPYIDRRDHIMWDPTRMVFLWLAVHLACRERGIDAHALGRAMLESGMPEGGGDSEVSGDFAARALRDAAASQQGAADNEFVFQIVPGDGERFDYGMDITRCAVCHAYAKHDAMDLTPYMCASDDVVSDRGSQGLRRTGTIALGAHRCDFRFKAGGEPLRLVEQFPEKIRSSS